ncbi:MFS transporter [Nocardioides sp. Bht2]|uniref:MFS transporter n=1 Tax=Nocardioides sp. Bht2 TaxID=3392297 RepID=UPI0039B5406F
MSEQRVNRRGVALLSSAHLVNDFYQGVVPAMLPFLAAAYGYSNARVAGLMFAATALSAITQPLFGWWADRGGREWLIWAGISTAALGIALCGVATSYPLLWAALAISGLGIAAFHPSGARTARRLAGNSTGAMGLFVLSGNIGFALGSLVAATLILCLGSVALKLLLLPAAVMAVVLLARLPRYTEARSAPPSATRSGANDWPSFLRLCLSVVVRSILFLALTTFGALYLVERFTVPTSVAATTSSVFLAAGVIGTLLGAFLADRIGRLTSQRVGFAASALACAGIVAAPTPTIAVLAIAGAGVAVSLPFAVMVTLGQDYLPQNIGVASGITVGLAVSIGGLFGPAIGWIADQTSLRTALTALIALPLVALLTSRRLEDPPTPGR